MALLTRAEFDVYNYTAESIDAGLQIVKDTPGGGSPTMNVAAQEAAQDPQGLTVGLLQATITTDIDSGSQAVGLCCLQSARDLIPGGGATGYAMLWHPDTATLRLLKLVNGLRTDAEQLASVSSVPGTLFELFWLVDPQGGWTFLRAATDGAERIRYQDFDNPYLTGVAEGGCYDDGGAALTFDITFLSMRLRGEPL